MEKERKENLIHMLLDDINRAEKFLRGAKAEIKKKGKGSIERARDDMDQARAAAHDASEKIAILNYWF